MGYVCPVCEDPQADGEHLANHVAFTAVLGDDAHEAWLEEHVPGWGDLDPGTLAERVTPHAEETEFPQVFEDTTGDPDEGHGHEHGAHGTQERRQGDAASDAASALPVDVADVDDRLEGDDEDVLAEARELTRQRRANAAEGGDVEESNDSADADDGDDSADADDGDDSADADDVADE